MFASQIASMLLNRLNSAILTVAVIALVVLVVVVVPVLHGGGNCI